jgi:hypothetical protein
MANRQTVQLGFGRSARRARRAGDPLAVPAFSGQPALTPAQPDPDPELPEPTPTTQ